ncbi:MAG: outer membrane beta-barrel protein [Verrucomicrobiota bacterium]
MKKLLFSCAVVFFALSVSAQAEGWYAGIESGYVEQKYTPHYVTLRDDRSNASFTNKSDGFELGLVAGYEFALPKRFSIATQFRGTWNNAEWTLFLPNEPANLKYETPFTLGFSVLPTYQVTDKFGIFFDLGILAGQVKQEKNSPSADRSSFDYNDWVPAYSFGGGVRYLISDHVECRLSYRKTIYDDFSYSGKLPSGRKVENIHDDPTSQSFVLSLIYRF